MDQVDERLIKVRDGCVYKTGNTCQTEVYHEKNSSLSPSDSEEKLHHDAIPLRSSVRTHFTSISYTVPTICTLHMSRNFSTPTDTDTTIMSRALPNGGVVRIYILITTICRYSCVL